jgi:hypothetical protein
MEGTLCVLSIFFSPSNYIIMITETCAIANAATAHITNCDGSAGHIQTKYREADDFLRELGLFKYVGYTERAASAIAVINAWYGEGAAHWEPIRTF